MQFFSHLILFHVPVILLCTFTYSNNEIKVLSISHLILSGVLVKHLTSPFAGFIAAIALTILSFKGFTTITNQGEEIVKPKKNIGRAIRLSILISVIVYILLAWAVSSNLPLNEIIEKKDYALAAAAEPALGNLGVWFTVIIAIELRQWGPYCI